MFPKQLRLALIWTIVIFILCNMRPSELPKASYFFRGFDKFVHAVFYFILTFLLARGFYLQSRFPLLKLLPVTFATFICLFYGGLIELIQLKVFTYRSGEWADFIADAIGTVLGIIPFFIYKQIITKPHEQIS
ncbi:glycine cleavage system protein H [Solitalea longa]|uniref:Glycine cleavage system protein H n=1 Tax=Solitalea longa TaxID=2079460 RepID=A0A2S5A9M5_9SPHI|nr:VanZ family protein [Solitalea longa]POY39278.1 glycine cleavage system protein H [Solitalea longa]